MKSKPTHPLKQVRKRCGLSRERLGALADCTAQTVQSIETGKHQPRLATARRIAAALHVTVDDIFPMEAAS